MKILLTSNNFGIKKIFLWLSIIFLTLSVIPKIFTIELSSFFVGVYEFGLLFFLIVSIFFCFSNRIDLKFLKVTLLILLVYYVIICSESLIFHYKFIRDPYVLLFISYIIYTFAFYGVISDKNESWYFLKVLSFCICVVTYPLILQRGISNVYILEISRATSASLCYLLLLATIFFIIEYLRKKRFYQLFLIVINLFIILMEQHRTVWVSSIWSFLVLSLYIFKSPRIDVKGAPFRVVIFIVLFFMFMLINVVSFQHRYSKALDFLSDRFDEISKYKERGTGLWRYEQYQYYLPSIKKNILFGTRFEGSKMAPLYELTESRIKRRHHFHSGYLTIFFYNGLFGFCLLYGNIMYYMYRFFKADKLTLEMIGFFSFLSSTFIYSIAYTPPIFSFVILGVGLAHLTKERNV